ncbi:MAG: c-type cytochrome, partial [Planctomycetaceae bacterium]
EPEGDSDDGKTVYREAQCIVCHVTKEDFEGNPLGGDIGPDLRKIGNKVNRRWLTAFFNNPHRFLPNTKMPRYHFSDKETRDLMEFALEEWIDFDLLDAEEKEPKRPPDSSRKIEQGRKLFVELGCIGCHDLKGVQAKPTAPDLSYIGSRRVHTLEFGNAKVRRSLPDFLFTKLKSPHDLRRDFHLSGKQDPAETIWKHLHPLAMFSATAKLPGGSDSEQLAWILRQVQQAGVLPIDRKLPTGPAAEQADWLVQRLNKVGALSPLKMPDFRLSDEDAAALTIALMSLSEQRVVSRRYEVANPPKAIFNPKDRFGELERRYRCLSCHKIRDSGDLLASDLTLEGSRVNREWLYHYLNKPYSMRRTLTIAMPIFHFPDKDSRLMADYMSHVFSDRGLESEWSKQRHQGDTTRGKQLFDRKGCIACHQLHETGGDIGPSLTTQVPEFPQGTWVGDKLKGGWIYRWLKNPQALLPDTVEPNLGLSDQEARDLTAYLLSLKNPEFQKKKKATARK